MRIPKRHKQRSRSSIDATLTGPFASDGGFCFTTPLPDEVAKAPELSSWDAPGWEVLEDGIPLAIVTKDHDEIRRRGHGRYCFWGETLYLSSIDGSIPGQNGRSYVLRYNAAGPGDAPSLARIPFTEQTGAMAVPGMISQEECVLLKQAAASIDLAKARIVEFGPFLGRSTMALAEGVVANPTLDKSFPYLPILSVDRFAWPIADAHVVGDVAAFIRSFTDEAGCVNLVRVDNDRVVFREVFDHFIGPTELVETWQVDFRAMDPIESEIGLLFLDGPKTIDEFRSVFEVVGDRLVPQARVVFQDFFVHTSGQLTGCVSALMEAGLLVPDRTAASTLACTWMPQNQTDWRQACPLSADGLADRVAGARLAVESICKENDPTYFMARLHLAEAQLRFTAGDGRGAAATLRAMRESYGIRPETWADLTDLVAVLFEPIDPAPVS